MSKHENGNEKSVAQNETVAREPAKRVKAAKPVKRSGFFATVFSHLAVATIAVIGVGAYMHWDDILTYTGSRVCSYDVLGKYAKTPVKVPPIDPKPAAPETTTETTTETTPAEEPKVEPAKDPKAEQKNSESSPKSAEEQKSAAPKAVAEIEKPKTPSFEDALQAARKQFWESDKAAVPAYEALIASKPKDADLQAEMANVYLKNEDKQKAIETFFNAGKMHIEQKQTKKTNAILDILKKISPEKSAELSKLLNTASN